VTTSIQERRKPPVSNALLWFAFIGPPVFWTVHLLASYPLVSVACRLESTLPLNLITAAMAAVERSMTSVSRSGSRGAASSMAVILGGGTDTNAVARAMPVATSERRSPHRPDGGSDR
jgi:hypothetical protein